MNKKLVSTLIGLSIVTTGGIDAATLKDNRVSIAETVKGERVEVEQVENIVSATLPWKGEQGIKVTYDLGDPTIIEKLADKRKKNIVTEKVPIVGGEGFKIDITLDEKPTTNVFCYFLEGWEQYDFFYQPPLTEQEIAEGAYRPPEIVGSYAVYHKTLKNHQTGGVNYETGKAFHIPFPYVWEIGNESEKQRADNLTFDSGNLCVTVPQKFLDEANYPIRIDPTFGYTTNGASFTAAGSLAVYFGGCTYYTSGALFTMPEEGTVTKISAYLANAFTNGIEKVQFGFYRSDLSYVASTSAIDITTNDTSQFQESSFSSPPLLSPGDYYISANGSCNTGTTNSAAIYVRHDTGGGVNQQRRDTVSGFNFEDPLSPTVNADNIPSIYATYTATESSIARSAEAYIKDSAIEIKSGTLIINQ